MMDGFIRDALEAKNKQCATVSDKQKRLKWSLELSELNVRLSQRYS